MGCLQSMSAKKWILTTDYDFERNCAKYEVQKNNNNTLTGKKHSNETRRKQSESLKGKE